MKLNDASKHQRSYILLEPSRPQSTQTYLSPVRRARPHSVNYSCEETLRNTYRKSPMPDQLTRISKLPVDFEFFDRENFTYVDKNHIPRQHKFALDQLKHLRTLKPAFENLYHSLLKTVDLPYMIQVVEFLSNRLDQHDKNRMIRKGCPLCSCTCKELELQGSQKKGRSESPNIKKVSDAVPENSVSTLDLARLKQVKVCSSCNCMFLSDNLSIVTECLLCQNQCYPGSRGDSVQLQMSVKCIEERFPEVSDTKLYSRPVSQQKTSNRLVSRSKQTPQSHYTQEVQTDPLLTHIILKSGTEKIRIETNSTQVCRFLLPTHKKNKSECVNSLNKTDSKPYLYPYEDIQKDTLKADQIESFQSFDYLKNFEDLNSHSYDEKQSKLKSNPKRRHRAVYSMMNRNTLNLDKESIMDSSFLPAQEAEELFTYYKDLKQSLSKCENDLLEVEIDQQEVLTDQLNEHDAQDNLEETLSKYLHILERLLSSLHKLEPRLAVSIWRCYLGAVLQCEYCLKQNFKTSKLKHLENEEIKKRDSIIHSLRNKISELQGNLMKTEETYIKKIEDIHELNLRYQSAMNLMKNKVSLISKAAKTNKLSR